MILTVHEIQDSVQSQLETKARYGQISQNFKVKGFHQINQCNTSALQDD